MGTDIVVLTANGTERPFSIEHAERLLSMPKNGGWELPKDSPFEFKDNAIKSKRSTRNTQKPKKQSDDSTGSEAAEQDTVPHGNES